MRKNNKVSEPIRLWDTEIGEILATIGLSIVFSGSIIASATKCGNFGIIPASFWVVFAFGAVLLAASESIVVLPRGEKYKNRKGRICENIDISPFQNEYVLISSVDMSIPMFWGEIKINMDCSNAKRIPSVDGLRLALLFSGSAECPEANAEAEAALFLARRGVILKSFKAIKADDYDSQRYYDEAIKAYEECA